jgi:hypothetical protein
MASAAIKKTAVQEGRFRFFAKDSDGMIYDSYSFCESAEVWIDGGTKKGRT